MTVLLLTKSYSYEQDFINKLNVLGYEVLCSKQLFLDLLNVEKKEFDGEFDFFDKVILSETISDQEAVICVDRLKTVSCTLIRKTIVDLNEELRKKWQKKGMSILISQTLNFEELREQLSASDQTEQKGKPTLSKEKVLFLEHFDYCLTKQEYRVFRLLKQSLGKCISRTDMCFYVWETTPSRSKESRLSGIVKSLKRKMKEQGLDETQLQTSWGKGYCLKKIASKETSFI
ncbi:helix-turn-helix domain-containing protein [Enterococcus sp. DIV0756]|uniref:helix-turn-helix domain-containing protein n=1 Tax=Enterococcus sp. DIV0756 TaxID=2774636 RepID=UPI003F2786D9